ncbi:MAG TPA: ATP-binding protein [Candidatus Desulfofervidus auxilii]|uniref:ATP-binding protein n=1 Tax=Desulfofervidus auxilii TaxID=1621989 RepID=A0A7C0Y4Z8_DESA2|nr:ATP-binding protein [Candidatus Desulfofervidus auxilii]
MKSEKLIKLFDSFVKKDTEQFYKVAWEIIEEEKKKRHYLLANKLKEILTNNSVFLNRKTMSYQENIPPIPRDNEKGFKLLEIKKFFLDWDDVILPEKTKDILNQIVKELENEELLATYGLKPKRKILFYGPPGTGKTLTAKVLSSVIGYPLVFVRFEAVISSYLGETASNLRRIFDFIEKGRWVVLFDEFDIIGKQRDDPNEHGEIKRVVNNFMLMLENYEGDSVIIASTNHPHLLDVGVWRRFDEIVYFDMPDKERRKKIFEKYLRVLKKKKKNSILNLDSLVEKTEGFSGADIEQVCIEALKKAILEGNDYIDILKLEDAISRQKEKISARAKS